ncbi:MAG: M28 family peptidase [Acidobacteria bacterium]|nr:M28 family peptidase [Acidobacteriota bacterium]MCI0723467.1 M28 family peptidase [Acidobacteriota bacterium]
MTNRLSVWVKHSQLSRLQDIRRHKVGQAESLGDFSGIRALSDVRQIHFRVPASVRLTSVVSLATLFLVVAVYAVTFEEISSGFHAVQSRRIQSTLQFLASKHFNGRATGTPEAELTAAYIASVFQRNGLQPPAGNGDSHVQSFELIQAVPREESRAAIEIEEGASLSLKMGEDFLPATWGPDSGEVRAQMVFAGYGVTAPELKYDDFAGLDVNGKIAIVLSKLPGGSGPKQSTWDFYSQKDYDEPLEKALAAQKAGAAGIIIILPSNENLPALSSLNFKNAKSSLASEVARLHIPALFVSYATGEKLVRGKQRQEQTLQAIQDKIDAGMKPVSFPLERTASIRASYERKKLQGRNVIGIIPGADVRLRDQCIVIGAHHDHLGTGETQEVYFGADDDASGTTGLLELAEAFQVGPLRPRRSIVLAAWGAEELGLLGSKHYARNPAFPLHKTVAMIQLDMIGRNEQRPADPGNGVEEEKDENNTNTVSIAGSAFSPDLKHWFEVCNRRIGLTLRYRYDSGQENLLKRSDHWCFLRAGVPSVFLFTGFHPDYHRPSDTADKINYEKMEKILRLLYLSAWELADQVRPPRFLSSTSPAPAEMKTQQR